jgi:hypothetical protein
MKRFWKQTKAFVDHCKENQTLLWKLLPLISKIPDDHFYPLIECIEHIFLSFYLSISLSLSHTIVLFSL